MVVGLFFWAGTAAAEDLVPLVPKLDPPAAGERLTQFHDALAQGLKAGGAPVMPAATVRARLKLGLENAGCDEGPCVQMNAGLVGSNRLATARVSSVGKNYTIEVRLFRGHAQTAKAIGRCDVCTHTEAIQTLERLATDLGSKAEEPPAPLPVVPRPAPRPTVAIPAAPTPAPTSPIVDQPPGPPAAKPRIPLWPALVAAGVGVVGIAVGAPLIAIDGNGTNCRGDARPDKRNCQDLYATAGGGWTLTILGAMGLAASAVLFPLHFMPNRPRTPSDQPGATVHRLSFAPLPEGGAVVGASGRF
jgi:hypothetical protein